MSMPRLTALLACPWANPSANSSQSARVRSRSMRPSCSSQKPARSNTGTPRNLQSSNAATGREFGSVRSPAMTMPQMCCRRSAPGDSDWSTTPAPASCAATTGSNSRPRPPVANCRSRAMCGADPSTRIRRMNQRSRMTRLNITRLARMQTSHTNSTLLSNSTAWLWQSDIEAAVHQQHGGKGEQAGDTGVDQQATPLDADFRAVEADGGGREHDRERQHRGEVGGAERGRLRCADTLVPRSEPGTRPATSTSRR